MLIPSIDLMDGKIVQLVQGERRALAFDNFPEWTERFRSYPLVQLIDLDAAMGRGHNEELVRRFCAELPCQLGGGIRDIDKAKTALKWGARKVMIGSALFGSDAVDVQFASALDRELGAASLVFAVDSRAGFVAVKGWKESTRLTAEDAMTQLRTHCSAFLYTHIDTEGTMQGFPMQVIPRLLQACSPAKLIVAGGIRSHVEVDELDKAGVDAVVGMAIYTGAMKT